MKYLVLALAFVFNIALADDFDHPVFSGQITGVFKEMASWFDRKEPVKPEVVEAKPVAVVASESKVAHVDVSDAQVKKVRDETCAKPNAVCFTETVR
jgi:NAD(P)H-dependent FMN reductase